MPLRVGRVGLAGLLAWMTVAGLAQPLDGLGDPQRLIIRGAESIETEDVRRAIARNWQIHLASLPTADRGTYLSLLQRLLARGYHRTGFPEAEATAYHDADPDAWEQAISAQSQAFEQTHTFPPQRAVIGVTRLLTELSINMLREAEPQRDERFGAAAKAIYKLLEGPMIEPFAQRLADASADKTRFNIPGDPQLMARLGMMSLVVGFLPYTDEAFDRGSWPWTITHAAALLSTGMGDRGQAELLRLYRDPDAGPLAMLAAARLLDAIGEHPAAAQFARQGRERLTTDHLAADLQPLILGDRLAPATARRLLASLRTLKPHEAEALAELTEYVTGHPAAAWAEAWRHDRQHPLPTDDPRALARRWLPLLRPPLEAEFNAFAPGPPAPPAAPR